MERERGARRDDTAPVGLASGDVRARDLNPSILTEDAEFVYFGPYTQYVSGVTDMQVKWTLENRSDNPGFAEDACCFIIVPADVKSFVQQRLRHARTTLRALRALPAEVIQRKSTPFVVWNLLFPWTDLAFTLGFVPGVILSVVYSSHLLMGPMAVTLLPAVLLLNIAIFFVMRSMFHAHGLKIRRNVGGLVIYIFGYSLLLQPARAAGYVMGLVRSRSTKN